MNKYPADEELELFIKQMERQELYAPRHMKEQILNQAFSKQTAQAQPKSGSRAGKAPLLAYRLKIIAGMAAAVFILFLLPSVNREYDGAAGWEKNEDVMLAEENRVDVNYVLNEGARHIGQKMDDWFEKMNILQGGNLYEN